MNAQCRLATYGSLAPGKLHNDQLDGLEGDWRSGTIRGRLVDAGWGSSIGFPGLVLDKDGFQLPVSLFESGNLPDHWERLDAFEGDGYQRVIADVEVDGETVLACVYILARMPKPI